MVKKIFLAIVIGLIGVANWAPLSADQVKLRGLTGAVETIEREDASDAETRAGNATVAELQQANSETVALAPMAGETQATVFFENNIQISGRTIELAYTDNTGENAGTASKAWYYQSGKFIYGHNIDNVFGFLDTAFDGDWLMGMELMVTMDGISEKYTVENYRLYDYIGKYALEHDGYSYGMQPLLRAELMDAETKSSTSYRMAIMTCYDGGEKRLVVFAN